MEYPVTIKQGIVNTRTFTHSELKEISDSLCIKLSPGQRIVSFSPEPPVDKSAPWQPTNDYGQPVGKIKFWKGNTWS